MYILWRDSIKAVSDLRFALATNAVLRNILQTKKYSGGILETFLWHCKEVFISAGIHLFKFNNQNTRIVCEICSKCRLGYHFLITLNRTVKTVTRVSVKGNYFVVVWRGMVW